MAKNTGGKKTTGLVYNPNTNGWDTPARIKKDQEASRPPAPQPGKGDKEK